MTVAQPSAAELERSAGVVLDVLWRCSWQASVLAAVVLALQFALRKRLSARWRHALWAIVLLRLMIPVTPPSQWSLFNVAPLSPRAAQLSPATTLTIIAHPAPPLASSRQSAMPTSWKLIVASLWLIGLAWMLSRIAWATLVLSLSVRRMKRIDDPAILALLERCRREMGVRREPDILSARASARPR
jgi:beta-lactamase regulating signal transducer with metallopeptidase domain